MAKGYMRFFFLWTRILFNIPLSISNSWISFLVKTLLQAEWVLMRGPFIHFAMTDNEISKFIFSNTHIKKNKTEKNLILILLYIKAIFRTVKLKLSFWEIFDCVTIFFDWKIPICAYQVLLSIGIIDRNRSNNKTKAP